MIESPNWNLMYTSDDTSMDHHDTPFPVQILVHIFLALSNLFPVIIFFRSKSTKNVCNLATKRKYPIFTLNIKQKSFNIEKSNETKSIMNRMTLSSSASSSSSSSLSTLMRKIKNREIFNDRIVNIMAFYSSMTEFASSSIILFLLLTLRYHDLTSLAGKRACALYQFVTMEVIERLDFEMRFEWCCIDIVLARCGIDVGCCRVLSDATGFLILVLFCLKNG
ncbi:hypothetical protein HELRODRAFT_167843 [Helobdella robusta]|uniref:Uncharacterized protein n=1 Tax=Helobdella robusta TaxID=6412 RepID=T1EZV3_HELRO|nr:hypothetical protein HELRODRAFT_167843 [Helobdella robusta]ESO10006.1 hypothetical protein HELRODRAFT_167843 [Helobdella robusta]